MNTIILLLFGIVIAILAIVIVAVCYYYALLIHKLSKAQKENLYLRFHLQSKSLNKINAARGRGLQIIQDATVQAEEILKKTQFFQADTSGELQRQLQELTNKQQETLSQASEQLSTAFTQAITELEQDNINIFKKTSKDIEIAAVQEVEAFKKQLTAETVDGQRQVDDKVQEAFRHALEEVTAYKIQRMQKIDEELLRIVPEATKEIIGKRLSYDDQKELFKNSLEKVKKEIAAVG